MDIVGILTSKLYESREQIMSLSFKTGSEESLGRWNLHQNLFQKGTGVPWMPISDLESPPHKTPWGNKPGAEATLKVPRGAMRAPWAASEIYGPRGVPLGSPGGSPW